jgi:hypothetical protein
VGQFQCEIPFLQLGSALTRLRPSDLFATVGTPLGHPDKPARLNSLGNSVIRFECLGQGKVQRGTVSAGSPSYPACGTASSNQSWMPWLSQYIMSCHLNSYVIRSSGLQQIPGDLPRIFGGQTGPFRSVSIYAVGLYDTQHSQVQLRHLAVRPYSRHCAVTRSQHGASNTLSSRACCPRSLLQIS